MTEFARSCILDMQLSDAATCTWHCVCPRHEGSVVATSASLPEPTMYAEVVTLKAFTGQLFCCWSCLSVGLMMLKSLPRTVLKEPVLIIP